MADEAGPKNNLDKKRKRLERGLVVLAVVVILGLTVLQNYVVRWGTGVPKAYSLLIFVLININVILLFLLLVLVLRNLYKIFFEQRAVLGAELRTKLVVAFVSLTLVPTLLLFYAALQFISTGHDYWFDKNVENSLSDSLVLAQFLSDVNERFAHDYGENISREIMGRRLLDPNTKENLGVFLSEKRRSLQLALVEVLGPDRVSLAAAKDPGYDALKVEPLPAGLFSEAAKSGRPRSMVNSTKEYDLIRVVRPLIAKDDKAAGFLVIGYQTAAPIKERMLQVVKGLEAYRNLKKLQDPIRISHYIALTIVALLSILVATWIAFHLANSITGPIMQLVSGTERLAKGDYDVTVEVQSKAGEINTLVDSFNRMTLDLKAGKLALTRKNQELLASNRELDERRRHMEVILQSVAAGVIAVDGDGVVTTINDAAENILGLQAGRILGNNFLEIMTGEQRALVEDLIRVAEASPRGAADRQTRIRIGDKALSLHVHLSRLKDQQDNELGFLVVFHDLSELEKVQRMSAWREVARRIAHEIKNPLTPIQLSTQRLRRRYGDRFEEDGQLFDECTQMIIRQVDELKRLVDEFSNFARLPEVNPAPCDLGELVEETLVLYQEAHKSVEFAFEKDEGLPVFSLDREQMKRALINLLDNAVAALDDQGRVDISLKFNRWLRMARLEVADNGVGISPQDKRRLFEPYFSTKKQGTGLGLAIVSTIVADHDGFVRVQDNEPKGTCFIIELPVRH